MHFPRHFFCARQVLRNIRSLVLLAFPMDHPATVLLEAAAGGKLDWPTLVRAHAALGAYFTPELVADLHARVAAAAAAPASQRQGTPKAGPTASNRRQAGMLADEHKVGGLNISSRDTASLHGRAGCRLCCTAGP